MFISEFNKKLYAWYAQNARTLPWVGEKNPYLVWLSEIILQQTRVEHGIKYYEKFKKKFPTVKKLAQADEQTILKLWEGLGYYSRARNLHTTAKVIAEKYNGKFPSTYSDILQLKGVGPYTAAAISAFAFELPYAIVDANVYRILARFCAIAEDTGTGRGHQIFRKTAEQFLDKTNPALHNQAMLDFGALVCKPVAPMCQECPVNKLCGAFLQGRVSMLPVKKQPPEKKVRSFHFFVIHEKKYVLVQKRNAKDIWKNLYQFPLLEMNKLMSWHAITATDFYKTHIQNSNLYYLKHSKIFTQNLTHQIIKARFFILQSKASMAVKTHGWKRIPERNLHRLAFPGIIREFLKEKK
jgi:A/G-specific adenine glycosylase